MSRTFPDPSGYHHSLCLCHTLYILLLVPSKLVSKLELHSIRPLTASPASARMMVAPKSWKLKLSVPCDVAAERAWYPESPLAKGTLLPRLDGEMNNDLEGDEVSCAVTPVL